MTNSSSTYFGIIMGAIIGAVISWWIYNRQKNVSDKQDKFLNQIDQLNERHDRMLRTIEKIEEQHQKVLEAILELNVRIEWLVSDRKNKEI